MLGFDKHANVGGACGEYAIISWPIKIQTYLLTRICVDSGRACNLVLRSPLVASQNFEYKMSNVLDKPLEVCHPSLSKFTLLSYHL